jgi:trimeric autotransporter adhesin
MSTLLTTTSSTRPSSPSAGDTYFETDTKKIIVWNGSAWYGYDYDDTTAFTNRYKLNFDGSGDYANTNYLVSSSATAMSISAWMNSTSYSGGAAIFSNEGLNFGRNEVGMRLNFNSSGNFFITVNDGSSAYTTNSNSATNTPTQGLNLFDGDWYHVVATISGTSGKVYVNGVEEFTFTSSVTFTGGGLDSYGIGYLGAGYPSYYWNGSLDEISVYEYELTSTQVSNIYNGGTPVHVGSFGLNLSPSGYWRGGDNDNGTGSTVTDLGSGGNDATLSGNAAITSIGVGESIYV